MKLSLFSLFLAVGFSSSAFAAYDNSWFQAEFWSGEYANGIAVVKRNTSVMGRASMDPSAPADLRCALPYKAVFHPWNSRRNAKSKVNYFTASKIVKLVAKEDFEFSGNDGDDKIAIKKGDEIEYLIYGSEGYFTVRIQGKQYGAGQDLFEKVEEVSREQFQEDQWFQLNCENRVRVWLRMDDLFTNNDGEETKYAPGLGNWGAGMIEYGKVRDLR